MGEKPKFKQIVTGSESFYEGQMGKMTQTHTIYGLDENGEVWVWLHDGEDMLWERLDS